MRLLNRYTVIFFIFSFLGWVWESIFCTICEHKWSNRGFLYGPVCPIYGFGAIIFFIIYDLIKAGKIPEIKWWMILIVGFIVSMILEYPTSWFLEKVFNARWWDYSAYPLNINGRTSVPTSLGFGVAAIIIMKLLIPAADKVISKCPDLMLNILSFIFIAIISADITLTVSAISDFQFKVASIDEGFQNHMTETVNRILSTQGDFYQKAVSRISLFVMAGRKGHIAKRLQKRDFKGLIQDFFDFEKKDKDKNQDGKNDGN